MKEIYYNGKSYKSITELAIQMKTSPANLDYRLKKYGGFDIKKEKKVLDHLGNYFGSIAEMYRFHKVNVTVFRARLNRGKSIKKSLGY